MCIRDRSIFDKDAMSGYGLTNFDQSTDKTQTNEGECNVRMFGKLLVFCFDVLIEGPDLAAHIGHRELEAELVPDAEGVDQTFSSPYVFIKFVQANGFLAFYLVTA